jgi:hypothetical protein
MDADENKRSVTLAITSSPLRGPLQRSAVMVCRNGKVVMGIRSHAKMTRPTITQRPFPEPNPHVCLSR